MKKKKYPDRSQQELHSFLENVLSTTDIDVDVYSQAFTHKTADRDRNYERLEIVGDSLLSLILVKMFFEDHPDMTENLITRYKDFLAQNAVLACWSTLWRFDRFIQMGRSSTGCDVTIKILADVFEAFLAAMYIDKGIETVCRFMVDTVHMYEQADCSRPYKIFQTSLAKTKTKRKRGGRNSSWAKVLANADGQVTQPSAAFPGPDEHKAATVIDEPVVMLGNFSDLREAVEDIKVSTANMDVQLKTAEIATHPIQLIPDSWEDVDESHPQIQLDITASKITSNPILVQDSEVEANKEQFTEKGVYRHCANVEREVISMSIGANSNGTLAIDEEFEMIQPDSFAEMGVSMTREPTTEMNREPVSRIADDHHVSENFEIIPEFAPAPQIVSELKFFDRANAVFEDWALYVM